MGCIHRLPFYPALAVGRHKFEQPRVGFINRRVVDLVQCTIAAEREPNAGGQRIRSPYTLFIAIGPMRHLPGGAGSYLSFNDERKNQRKKEDWKKTTPHEPDCGIGKGPGQSTPKPATSIGRRSQVWKFAVFSPRPIHALVPFRMVSEPFSRQDVEKPLNMLYLAFAERGMRFRPVKSKLARHLRRSFRAPHLLLVCGLTTVAGQIAQQDPVPMVNVGGNYMEAQFARLEFAQKVLEEQNRKSEEQRKQQQKLVDSGTVSALDLQAPGKAVSEFNKGADLLQHQKSREAIAHLEKAITVFPKFISAHNDLGL